MPFDKEPEEKPADGGGFEAMMKGDALGKHRNKSKPPAGPDEELGLELELGEEEGEAGAGEVEAISQLSAELGLSPEQAKQAYDIVSGAMGVM
mgnify:FL=1